MRSNCCCSLLRSTSVVPGWESSFFLSATTELVFWPLPTVVCKFHRNSIIKTLITLPHDGPGVKSDLDGVPGRDSLESGVTWASNSRRQSGRIVFMKSVAAADQQPNNQALRPTVLCKAHNTWLLDVCRGIPPCRRLDCRLSLFNRPKDGERE